MNILLTNTKKDTSVALVPSDVDKLVKNGYRVFFTSNVGACLNIKDDEYKKAGANLVTKLNANTFKQYDLILSPKALSDKIYGMANPNQVFWFNGYLVSNTKLLLTLLKSGAVSLCSESIHSSGDYKFLRLYEEMKGTYAPVLASYMLANNTPSTVLGKIKGTDIRTTVLILNYSYSGYYACKNALALGCHVVYLDQNADSLKDLKNDKELAELAKLSGGALTTDTASFEHLMEYCKVSNVLLTCNQVPTMKTAIRITKEMLMNMLPGSVFIDLATESGVSCDMTYKFNQIHDFKLPNNVKQVALDTLPTQFNNSWSFIYSELITKILVAHKDVKSTFDLINIPSLSEAVVTFNHCLTNQDIAQSLHLLYTPLAKAKK